MPPADPHELKRWVAEEFALGEQTGPVDVAEVDVHPSADLAACTLTTQDAAGERHSHVVVVDLAGGAHTALPIDATSSRSPVWSPDGQRLCLLAAGEDGATRALVLDPFAAAGTPLACSFDGEPETVRWSGDGSRIALVVAQAGAEISDVHGSGTVRGAGDPWYPQVSPSPGGRRLAVVWQVDTGTTTTVTDALNVWELGWWGDRLLAVASRGAGEGAWYAAELVSVGLDGRATTVHRPDRQLAQPGGSPDGRHWSVLSGPASDRGLLAGRLLVGAGDAPPEPMDTLGVDVTDHRWVDSSRILFTGMRGLDTVFGLLDVDTRKAHPLLERGWTSGRHQPELGGLTAAGRLVLCAERHDRPPALTVIGPAGAVAVLATTGSGTAHVVARTGSTRPVSWTSTDGLQIEGLLTVPDRPAPHPLVVNVHGGPVAAWHDGWIGRDLHTTLLVSRGYAVLRPNPRGSTGRGAGYVEAVIGDLGGRDVDDLTTAVLELVRQGLADGTRVGLTGNSYGGYMAAWVPCVSDLFAATVARSPVTDWRSQHFTSNLAEFDALFVQGDPLDPSSRYATRSPLLHRDRIRTPMLLTAGALDLATPASQARQLHVALAERNVDTELVIYPQEGHGVRSRFAVLDQVTRMLRWFDRYLGSEQPPD